MKILVFAGVKSSRILGVNNMEVAVAELDLDELEIVPVSFIHKPIVSTIVQNNEGMTIHLRGVGASYDGPYRHVFLD